PVGDFELLLCHGTVCVVGKIRDLILQLSKSSIYSTKPTCSVFPQTTLFTGTTHRPQKLHSKKFQTYITNVRTVAEMLPFCYFTHGG
ncbi:hypothetical protein ACUNHT_27320, partial [Serratia sp. IR-2025]